MQKVLFGLAVISGIAIAFVDSRSGWDDTGITAFSLLLASGLLSLLGFKRPWLLALSVGIWLPLYEGILSRNPMILLVLFIPLIGSYAGWGGRRVIDRALHPA